MAAMAFLAETVHAAGDRTNGGRLKELSEKAEGIAGWCKKNPCLHPQAKTP